MATTFLELANAINRRFNEVELGSTNFSGALGHYGQVRDAVNAALNELYAEQYEWPFLRNSDDQTLVAYQTRYDFPADFKYVDIESFRIRYDEALNASGSWLRPISYDEYLQSYSYQETAPDDTNSGIPRFVFQTPDQRWGVTPKPDQAYVVDFEYFSQPAGLSAHDDTMVVPDAYKYVVLHGAEYYTHLFRDNIEAAARAEEKFKKGIKDMRKILINRNDYVRSSAVPHTGYVRGGYI
jgi:hypothetical protein